MYVIMESLKEEFSEYKEKLLASCQCEVFDSAYGIVTRQFILTTVEQLLDNKLITDALLQWMIPLTEKKELLAALYDIWMGCDVTLQQEFTDTLYLEMVKTSNRACWQ